MARRSVVLTASSVISSPSSSFTASDSSGVPSHAGLFSFVSWLLLPYIVRVITYEWVDHIRKLVFKCIHSFHYIYIYLESHQEIRTLSLEETVLCEFITHPLDLSAFFVCASVGVELPVLPPDMVVHRQQPRSTLRNLQLPHDQSSSYSSSIS